MSRVSSRKDTSPWSAADQRRRSRPSQSPRPFGAGISAIIGPHARHCSCRCRRGVRRCTTATQRRPSVARREGDRERVGRRLRRRGLHAVARSLADAEFTPIPFIHECGAGSALVAEVRTEIANPGWPPQPSFRGVPVSLGAFRRLGRYFCCTWITNPFTRQRQCESKAYTSRISADYGTQQSRTPARQSWLLDRMVPASLVCLTPLDCSSRRTVHTTTSNRMRSSFGPLSFS